MKTIKNILPFLFILLSFNCRNNDHNPTSIVQTKSELVIYALGDTSGYTNHPFWYAFIREPKPVKQVFPQSPEYAKINKIDGNVFVELCITKVGTVRGAVVKTTDNDLFNRPSLEAAIQWKFTPALGSDSLSYDIWYSYPFRFINN
jgi:TonB family protein